MSETAVRAAVQRIMTDPDFARRAYEQPDTVLPAEYGLDPSQCRVVHEALTADVEETRGEVAGFTAFDWEALSFSNLAAVSSPRDPATGQASGKRQHAPLKVVKEWGPGHP